MDGNWCNYVFFGIIYAWSFMTSIISKSILVISGAFMTFASLITIILPNINNFMMPIEIDNMDLAIMMRTYAGFFLACGYLIIRFVYSSSKVQIGSMLLYIFGCMILARIFSLFYDGTNEYSLLTLSLGFILFCALYLVQRARKNQISYDL